MTSREERREEGRIILEAIAGIKRVTRSRPIEFDAFNFPSLNQRCAKGMRGVIRGPGVDSGGVKERRERRDAKKDKRRYRESNWIQRLRRNSVQVAHLAPYSRDIEVSAGMDSW